jgi:twitching motility two-component system response regulator PilG
MNNNLANPLQILKEKSQQAWTGCLEISEPQDLSVSWKIYLDRGKLQYATSNVGQQERLNYLWQEFQNNADCPILSDKDAEYAQLHQHCLKNQLTDNAIEELFKQLSQEALIQSLSIDKTTVNLLENRKVFTAKIDYSWQDLYDKNEIDYWYKIKKYISSPFAKLYLSQKNSLQFYKLWKKMGDSSEFVDFISTHNISDLVTALIEKSNLYILARKTSENLSKLAGNLHPFMEETLIEVLPFQETTKTLRVELPIEQNNSVKPSLTINTESPVKAATTNNERSSQLPLIACVDDSRTVQTQVKMTLETVGYEVISIQEAGNALKALASRNPAVILMDINMPTINGYDLCAMLRRSQKFKEIPIIMLTGRDGIIDRMRAKLVGSTDYLTKPFDPEKLVETIGKFIQTV